MNLESPRESAPYNWKRKVSDDELPSLRFCSDIYWGDWCRDNPDVKNLRVYGAHNIVHDDATKLAARRFTQNGHEKLNPWPGVFFHIMSPEGQALVGSPIGATAAHLLIRHKAELGVKWIKKVTVFTDDAPPDRKAPKHKDMHMFFHIEDIPIEEITDPEKDKNKNEEDNEHQASGEDLRKRQVQSGIVYEQR